MYGGLRRGGAYRLGTHALIAPLDGRRGAASPGGCRDEIMAIVESLMNVNYLFRMKEVIALKLNKSRLPPAPETFLAC